MSARFSDVPYDARPPGFVGARRARFAPATTGTFHTLGWALTATGAVTTPALATTSIRAQLRRTRFTSGVLPTAGLRSASPVCWRGSDGSPPSGRGGFCFSIRFCLDFGGSSRSAFVGVATRSTPVVDAGNPSTLDNVFGIGCDPFDTSWSVIRGDATPAPKIGIPGAPINSDVLDLTVFCAPNSSEMHVYVSNVSTGNVLFRGTYGDKLPDGASLLYTHAHVRAPSLSPSIEVASAWLEIPDGAVAVPSVQGRDGVFDVRSFGARADGVTSDSAAFRAALDAMSTVDTQSDREATLYIPPGTYALGADLLLERAVRVKGASRDRSRLVFGPYKGVKIFSLTNSPSGMGDGANVSIEDVTIALDESVIPNLPNWFPAAVYGAGARVLPAAPRASSVGNSWEYYYEAIKGGTTSATEPNWFGGTTGPGAQAPDPSSVWAPLTDYKRYAVVRSASRYDIFFLCTEPGTSKAGAEPAWNATLGDTTDDGPDLKWTTFSTEAYFIADGGTLASPGTGVVWACRLAAGIFAQTRFSLRRVAITGAVNAGLHVQATGAPNVVHKGNANGFAAYDLEVRRCGGGIVTRADECNAGLVSNAFITTRGPSNDKSFGIADRGLLGNRYIGIRVESCGGPVLDQTSPANSGALMGISAPATCGAVVNNSSQGYGLFGGFLAAGFAPGSSYMGASGPSDWRDVWAVSRDANGDPINEAKLYAAPYVMGFKAYDDAAFCAVGYDFPGAGLTGWWSLFHSSVGTTALAWSGTNAEDAPGSVVGGGYALAYPGLLLGSPATMIASADAKPVAGSWRRGDLVINAMAASGDPSFWQCVSEAPLDFLDGPALP